MNDEVWTTWQSDWSAVLRGIGRLGSPAFATELIVGKPASVEQAVQDVSVPTGLPESMADVVRNRAAHVSFHWRLVDLEGDGDIEAPMFGSDTPLWGGCHTSPVPGALWDLAALPGLIETHQSWLDDCFQQFLDEDPNDPYGSPWANKLPFIEVADGDMIGIDLADGPARGQVVYLCHDDYCDLHGKALGTDFVDFITRWSRIGCVGPEGSFLELFFEDGEFAPATSATVQAWRSWLGMTSPQPSQHRP